MDRHATVEEIRAFNEFLDETHEEIKIGGELYTYSYLFMHIDRDRYLDDLGEWLVSLNGGVLEDE